MSPSQNSYSKLFFFDVFKIQEPNVFVFWEQLYVMSVFILAYTINMISYSISGNKEINLIDTKTIQ